MDFLVCYDIMEDLRTEEGKRRYRERDAAIVALLKNLGACRLQGSVWQLTARSYQEVTDAITTVLRKHDRIVVTRLHDKAWLYNPLENC